MGHGGTKVQVIKPASPASGSVSQGDPSPSQASKPTSETNQSQALDAGRLANPSAENGVEQSQGLSLPMGFPSEASGQSIESASAGLAARKRRDKRVTRVSTGLLQEPEEGKEGKRDSTQSAVVGRRASQSVMPEMLDPELESFLTKAFQKHFLLKSVPDSEYQALSLSMKVKHAVADEVIVSQGDQAESVYFIRHGTFALSQDSVALLKTLGPGDSFGELALLYSVPSSTTITAVGSGELWKLERHRFLECKEKLSSSQMEKALEFFQACQDFRYLKEDDQKSLAAVCTSKSFEDGNPIVMHDEQVGDVMFIVISGQVSVGDEKSDTFDRGSYGKPGSVIGSVAVIYNKEQVGGAFAKGTVECLCLNKASLSNFSASVIDVLRRAAFKAILHSLPRNPLDPEPWRILSEQQVFVVGPIPFGAGEEDQMKLFAAINEAPLTFPNYVPDDATQVLSGLLERRPGRRLGGGPGGAKEIKKHLWFKSFDWDALAGGFFPPPWQPDAKAQMSNWEEPDGDLMDHVSTETFGFGKGMEWAKIF